ncbi:MAG: carboxypeptidase regulatory-like domain-containing protein [Planctomycetota bacterium]
MRSPIQRPARLAAAVLLLASSTVLARTAGDADPARPQDSGASDDAVLEAQEAPPTAKGRVLFEGEPPLVKELEVSAAAAEGCCPAGETVDRTNWSLLLSKDEDGALGIAHCVVTVKVEGVEVEIPEEPYELDQKGCRFLPHVLVAPKGAKVAFLNSDKTSHNVRLRAVANEALNQTVAAGKRLERTFDEAEAIRVACDMHPWMSAWVVVTDATHWAVSGPDGRFALTGLPAGKHEATVWHETLGKKTFQLVVAEDGTSEDVVVKLERKKSKKRRRRRR